MLLGHGGRADAGHVKVWGTWDPSPENPREFELFPRVAKALVLCTEAHFDAQH